ncbi:MAG TPA: DedA family protein [Actinospica sp.]|nr:DedA family protein [Actinospica sp.]
MLNTIINHLLIFSGWSALLLVFLLPALESSVFLGFVIPGETAVVVGGFLAYEHRVSFAGILAAAILGAIIGDSIGFWVGERWGDSLLRRLPKRFVRPEHVEQGKQSINRLGGRAVFAGRWVSVLRALVPGLCGTSGMRYGTFLLWNAIGGITWATAYTLLGYLAGSAWQRVEHYTSVVSYALLGAIVLAIVAVVLVKRRRQRARDEETREELAEHTPDPEADGQSGTDRRSGPDRHTEQSGHNGQNGLPVRDEQQREEQEAQPAGRGAEPGPKPKPEA